MWLVLSLFSGIFDGLVRMVIKTTKAHFLLVATAGILFALPIYAGVLIFEGIPVIKEGFWLIVLVHAALLTCANLAMVKAHQKSPLILTVPYLSLTPAFLLITSPILKGGQPNVVGLVGVLLITAGLYFLNINKKETGILGPLRTFWKESGSRWMFSVAVIYSITANLDNLALKSSNLSFYLVIDAVLVLVFSLIFLSIFVSKKEIIATIKNKSILWRFIAFGGIMAGSVLLGVCALNFSIVPFVISMKRFGVVLATVAGMIYFHEKENLSTRAIGFALAFGGATLITFFGMG